MTEQKAIEILSELAFDLEKTGAKEVYAIGEAVEALREIQQYRALGTVEELKQALEVINKGQPVIKNLIGKLEKYQKIGTLTECRKAVKKQREIERILNN